MKKHLKIFNKLYNHLNGYKISKEARANNNATEYVYGEIEFAPFIALLSLTHPNQETIFYDLGSGTGKAVLACAMVFNIKRSCGIEIFPQLHDAAQNQLQLLSQEPGYSNKSKKIHFLNDNFLNAHFEEANLLFINSTSLFGKIWDDLTAKLALLPVGTQVITLSKALDSQFFEVTNTTIVEMSWGPAHAFIQKRRS